MAPTTEFEKDIKLSREEDHPFFKEITKLMRQEIATINANGIAILAGLYETEKTSQKAWWASRQSIEKLLPQTNQEYEDTTTLAKSLSSTIRLKILAGLCYGPKKFGELVTITGIKGGQLTHHLEPLLETGLLQKKEANYVITEKGWKTLLALLLVNQDKTR